VTTLTPAQAYTLWAPSYDETPNPLVALERAALSPLLRIGAGDRVLDCGTGTGRWLEYAIERARFAYGIDESESMLRQGQSKKKLNGRLIQGSIYELPFAADSFDLAICSFVISYVAELDAALAEMVGVSRRLILADLHPEAEAAGWNRGFRSDGEAIAIAHHAHDPVAVTNLLTRLGMKPRSKVEARFDEPERDLFRAAGRLHRFEETRSIPAILVQEWER